jgi:hypothetical protein
MSLFRPAGEILMVRGEMVNASMINPQNVLLYRPVFFLPTVSGLVGNKKTWWVT